MYLSIRLKLWKYIRIKSKDEELKKQMIKYSSPLILNNIGWWITNASDRYILTAMKGLSENGIYSVSYKVPSILNVVQAIFSQAWIMSAVKAYDDKENEFIGQTYQIYNCVFVLLCSVIIIFTKIITKILAANDFYIAWRYAPFLMISVLFTSLSNFLAGLFAASKESKIMGKTTIIGAVINIILNIILIYFIGTIGAAISTMISYIVVWFSRIKMLKNIINLEVNLYRDGIGYLILIMQAVLINILNIGMRIYIIEGILLISLIMLYNKEIKGILDKIWGIIVKKKF